MKDRLEKLGGLFWILVVIFLSAVTGLGAYREFLGIDIQLMPVWAKVTLSVLVGIGALIVLWAVSRLILNAFGKDHDCPDFGDQV